VEVFRASRSSFIVKSRTLKGPPCSGGPFSLVTVPFETGAKVEVSDPFAKA
jgi:hypothetical protein